MDPVLQFLIGVAGFLLAGVLSEILFEKTKIPDALWLIILGILIGPVLNRIDEGIVYWLLDYFAALTLIVVLFEGGRRLSILSLKSSVGSAVGLSIATFILSVSTVSLASWIGAMPIIGVFDDWSWPKALMLGSIVGGSSSIILMPTFQFAKVKEKITNLVSVESAITDALSILGAIIFLKLAKRGMATTEIGEPFILLGQNLGLGLGLGVVGGLIGVLLLPFKKGKYAYAVTLAALILFYVGVTNVNGNGALAVLVLSIMMGNAKLIGKLFKIGGERSISTDVNFLHEQLSFVFKTFFFIIIGFLIRPPFPPIFFGFFIAVVLIITRELACKFLLKNSALNKVERALVSISVPRGLAAGVLATLPLTQNLSGITKSLASTVFSVVIFTVIYFSARFALMNRRAEIKESSPPETPTPEEHGNHFPISEEPSK